MKECPCRWCTKRCVTLEHNCHTDCKDFLEWSDKQKEFSKEQRKKQWLNTLGLSERFKR